MTKEQKMSISKINKNKAIEILSFIKDQNPQIETNQLKSIVRQMYSIVLKERVE